MVIAEQKAAAEALHTTDRTLRTWEKLPGFPKSDAGYDIDAIRKWQQANERKGSVADDQLKELNKAIRAAKLQEMLKKNKKLELEIGEREKELLPKRIYETFISGLLSGVGDWCEQLPGLIEAEVPKKYHSKVRSRITEELRRMRNQLADDLKRVPQGG